MAVRGEDRFDVRMKTLARGVGDGKLTGTVEVDQVYARYQHEGLDLKHPDGGQAKYLEQPFYGKHRDYLQQLADQVLHGSLTQAMTGVVEGMSGLVYENAPLEFGDLKASGHPSVRDGEAVVYDRAPMIHRLSKEELDAKSHLRSLGFGHDY